MSSAMKMDFICRDPRATAAAPSPVLELEDAGVSDNEDSEDEQLEHAAWQDVDLNPAVDLVAKLVREALDAGKTYNKSITAKTSQLLTGCDGLLLELKSLSETRVESRQRSSQRIGHGGSCLCGQAMAMLPFRSAEEALAVKKETKDTTAGGATQGVDEGTEDQTDRALAKMEAAVIRVKEMAELIQATSMQGEANLVSKVSLQSGTFQALEAAVQASAAAATATAIAQERGRSSSAFSRLCMPLQVQKLQEWYYSYPRPLLDELTLMRTILNYRPYANPFHVGGLSLAHVRDWFKRRRFRERMRYVKLAVEAGHDAQAAEEEIDLRLEQRIAQLRASVDPNELVKEVDRVRAQSYLFDAAVNTFTRPDNIRSYIVASHSVPTAAEQQGNNVNGRLIRQRSPDLDLDDSYVVKHASVLEVMALQNRLRSLIKEPKSAIATNGLQQVVDLLRAMKVEPDVRIQSGLVVDLKLILKEYTKPTLLRKATIALLESLGMNRRAVVEPDADADMQLSAPASPALSTASSAKGRIDLKCGHSPRGESANRNAGFGDDSSLLLAGEPPTKKAKPVTKSRAKERKGRVLRPMKFSMDQLTALEAWFQQKYKPSQEEMENYLVQLNTPPLRDVKKQTVDVNMTQLRRWFNKRRCLRRPPFALMTQQEAAKEGSKNPAVLKAALTPTNNVEPVESMDVDEDVVDASLEIRRHSQVDINGESSDVDDDDDDDDDEDDEDDGDDDSSDDGEHLIDLALA
uniref:Homeobox domain-containing protein n=1 Tax=Hyaloperonospora arabidopsidis (strain Emoy2) TaxID=559515 RepID=M4C0Y5_HYAAE